jgi:WD40 repeat protein
LAAQLLLPLRTARRQCFIVGGCCIVQDGMICLTDLSTLKPAGKLRQTLGDAVPSLCWHPGAGAQLNLFAAAGSAVAEFDLRRGMDASAAVRSFAVNQEEVNSVAVSAANGGWLAAGDDGGEVQVISLQDTQRARQDAQQAQQDDKGQQAAGGSALLPGGSAAGSLREPSRPLSYKTLRRGHSNICSAVAFRPHRPWELLSGGLDCTVVKWDFSRLRTLHGWSLSGEAAASGGGLHGGGRGGRGGGPQGVCTRGFSLWQGTGDAPCTPQSWSLHLCPPTWSPCWLAP